MLGPREWGEPGGKLSRQAEEQSGFARERIPDFYASLGRESHEEYPVPWEVPWHHHTAHARHVSPEPPARASSEVQLALAHRLRREEHTILLLAQQESDGVVHHLVSEPGLSPARQRTELSNVSDRGSANHNRPAGTGHNWQAGGGEGSSHVKAAHYCAGRATRRGP